MIKINLTQGQVAYVDDCDADLLKHKWWAAKDHNTFYAGRKINIGIIRKNLLMHCVIMERMLGRPLAKGEKVDHKDGNGLNNQRNNLRLATTSQNLINSGKRPNNKSGFKGINAVRYVSYIYWQARISFKGTRIDCGLYKYDEEGRKDRSSQDV